MPKKNWRYYVFLLFSLATAGLLLLYTPSWQSPSGLTLPTMPQAQAQNRWMRWRSLAAEPAQPMALNDQMRTPLIYFRKALDQRWRPGFFFVFCLLISIILKLLPFKILAAARQTMRENVVKALTYAFVYSFLLMFLARACFVNEAMLPLGLLCFGILEASYALGLANGIRALADRICEVFKITQDSKSACALRFVILVVTCMMVALLSAIPGLAHLPRVGNRLVLLLSMLGLGGILREQYRRSKS